MTVKPNTILIVDDEKDITKLLHQKLSGEGYHCQKAGSVAQALGRLRSNPAELVILDIKMPGRSGIKLLLEIKTNYPDTEVIMATGVTDIHVAIQCLKKGAYDYLIKPFNLGEVVLSVEKALEKRRLELENRYYQRHLEQKVEEQAKKIRTVFLNAIAALVHALEAKDKYTSGHSRRVSEISVAIAKELGMAPDRIERIRLAGLLHDIGKIGVRESVLNKRTQLTRLEYRHVLNHCEVGEQILAPVVENNELLRIVRHHHEHFDGSGYPDGLSNEKIPLDARILAVADAYHAMTCERPYRKAISTEAAYAEIERGKGTHFDPVVADCFLRIRKPAHSVRRD